MCELEALLVEDYFAQASSLIYAQAMIAQNTNPVTVEVKRKENINVCSQIHSSMRSTPVSCFIRLR